MKLAPALLAACTLGGCVSITDEEYKQRLVHSFSGELTVPEGTLLGGADVWVGLVAVDLRGPAIVPDDERLVTALNIGPVTAGEPSTYTLELPGTLEEDWRYETSAEQTGAQAATFMLVAWEDRDGSGLPDSGDHLLGGNLRQLVAWLPAESAAWAGEGIQPGYNLMQVNWESGGFESIEPVRTTQVELDLPANLAQHTYSELTALIVPAVTAASGVLELHSLGSVMGTISPESPGLHRVDLNLSGPGLDVLIESDFGAPPDDHLMDHFATSVQELDLEALGLRASLYIALAYRDLDRSGDWGGADRNEEVLARSDQAADRSRFAVWLQPTRFEAVTSLPALGDMGWSLVNAEDSSPEAWDQGLVLARD